ncbi:NupC/NupG family nucleoside CNT transporter [Bacillus sp. B15-48]|uniref:NupC/NupG family nucleoside CNT transporter n=1 Tax=Bacillus sp. B15-48 TaxID=1548601 RepID=UPI00193FADE6|nr:NupC/NupG family nucleoside CNT transporter [Bacillus sp. B15-48]MBM4761177.1 NupC/NupG family nucleoside CNT transporter [Bacillus sp. B15-48]
MDILWGIFGIFIIMLLAFLLSKNKKAINLRTIGGALGIQILFGFIVLKWETGRNIFSKVTAIVQSIIDSSNNGIQFLFGGMFGVEGMGFIFAFQVLTVIIFFSSLISVLFYLGVMQLLTKIIGGFLSMILGTSKPESMSASANIFVGLTEAPLVVKPYLANMTKSELFAVMTGGAASVSGSVLVGYSLLGVPLEYLIAAAFMAAPAGLLIAKILVPETEQQTVKQDITIEKDPDAVNIVDAAANGALVGLKMALNIGALLLAFISLIALVNLGLGSLSGLFGFESITLEQILGILFAPLAFVIGVPWDEAVRAGSYIGQKFVLNEFVAYSSFSADIGTFSAKTVAVISFALCGFANLGAMAMMLGGIGGLAPSRKDILAKFGFLAIIGGTLANLLSAAIAGMLI